MSGLNSGFFLAVLNVYPPSILYAGTSTTTIYSVAHPVIFLLVILLTVSTVFAGEQDAIYVKAGGSNNNSGFTEREPVQRLALALNLAARNPTVKK
jgi:hypothetical protein